MQTVIQVIAYGGPLFLALMGVFVVDHRPETFQGRLLWYGGFIFVAFLSIWAAVKAANAGKKEVISMLMGSSDHFPEIYGMVRSDGKLELWIANAGMGMGQSPLYDVYFSVNKAGTLANIASRNWGALANFTYDTGIAVDQGTYQINFGARNGMFVEMLIFGPCDGKIIQAISITKPLEGGRSIERGSQL